MKVGMLAALVLSLSGAALSQEIRATVDGSLVRFPDNIQPIMINNRVLVPVRGVFEHMNAVVLWDQKERSVSLERGADRIRLTIDSYNAMVNGREVPMEVPATIYAGRTMVPLRFLTEALGASVEWVQFSRTVEITTTGAKHVPPYPGTIVARIEPEVVVPFVLSTKLSSNDSNVGDRFTAMLDTTGTADYANLPVGSKLEGRVATATAKAGRTPGVLGLEFDRVVLPDGSRYAIYGELHGLDSSSVTNENGKLIAKPESKQNSLQYVGYGAGAGTLVAILTKGNIVTTSVIGAALGYLYGEIQKDPAKARDVTLASGSRFGVRLTNELAFRVPVIVLK